MPTRKKAQGEKQKPKGPSQSPYTALTTWMLSPAEEAVLEDWVVNALNPAMVLCMFGRIKGVTVFLNEYFNDYNIYTMNKKEFFIFLKEIVQKKKITKNDLSYLKHHKEDKELSNIHKKFPMLKRYEVYQFLEELKKDEMYEEVLYALGLIDVKPKKTKVTKQQKKKDEELKKNDSDKVVSFDNWLSNF